MTPEPKAFEIRETTRSDGPRIFSLVRACGTLNLNSAYFYVFMADAFGTTCAIAEQDGKALGVVIGLRPPRHPQALFVWQVGVHPDARGQRLATRMFDAILARPENRDVTEVLATVTPDNQASERTFASFAKHRSASMTWIDEYPVALFEGVTETPEAERMLRISGLS